MPSRQGSELTLRYALATGPIQTTFRVTTAVMCTPLESGGTNTTTT